MQRERSRKSVCKIGLLGSGGVGKDTFTQIVRKNFPLIKIEIIRLAEPLYAVQNYLYAMCGIDKEEKIQDGELLNFLGVHMRKINPDVLRNPFEEAVKSAHSQDLLLCSDVRPKDVEFVRKQGFLIVHIHADPQIALERRKKRGDLTLGASSHVTEAGLDPNLFDEEIANNGTLEEFEANVLKFMRNRINYDPDRKRNTQTGDAR